MGFGYVRRSADKLQSLASRLVKPECRRLNKTAIHVHGLRQSFCKSLIVLERDFESSLRVLPRLFPILQYQRRRGAVGESASQRKRMVQIGQSDQQFFPHGNGFSLSAQSRKTPTTIAVGRDSNFNSI